MVTACNLALVYNFITSQILFILSGQAIFFMPIMFLSSDKFACLILLETSGGLFLNQLYKYVNIPIKITDKNIP